jgi:NAD(P)-dependent dehydrogenase (short-subunit alcohol dehydrogenase family)
MRILITGSSGAIGGAIVIKLMEQGHEVFGIDKELNPNLVHQLSCDLSTQNGLEEGLEWIETSAEHFGALINCAGVTFPSENRFDIQVYYKTMRINLEIPFIFSGALIQKALRNKQPLSIVNITSLGAHQGFPDNPSYQVSKAGLSQLSRSISVDFGRYNIRANNLVPGYIRTPMTEKSYFDKAANEARASRSALKRWGEPSDLLGAVELLISDSSNFIAGSDIFVDGGWHINGL